MFFKNTIVGYKTIDIHFTQEFSIVSHNPLKSEKIDDEPYV